MPIFEPTSAKIELNRDVVILDTNVLYAAFSDTDQRHEEARIYLDDPIQLIVPMPVVIETWGLLVGRDNRWDDGFEFLSWMIDPRSGVVIITHCDDMAEIYRLASRIHIDCVDATILLLADRISKECHLNPPCKVATYDTRDFFNSLRYDRFKLTIVDMRTGDMVELDAPL